MKVSRRDFVSTAGCAAAASLCALPSLGVAASSSSAKVAAKCTLLDLKSNCALPESFAGMQAALGDGHRYLAENEFASGEFSSGKLLPRDCGHLVIIAGAGSVRSETFSAIAKLLERGVRVLWESGAAFLVPRELAEQQALARDYFGISIDRPVNVWSQMSQRRNVADGVAEGGENRSARKVRAIGHQHVPYVVYRWPREAHVRDFSRVIPVSAENGHAIAHWGELCVAWSKPVGAGAISFFGSPIGPALRAGDPEASSLLHSIIAS
jgi:hypothetical protein